MSVSLNSYLDKLSERDHECRIESKCCNPPWDTRTVGVKFLAEKHLSIAQPTPVGEHSWLCLTIKTFFLILSKNLPQGSLHHSPGLQDSNHMDT